MFSIILEITGLSACSLRPVIEFFKYLFNMNFKIGLLLPSSVIYPTINFDLINGLRSGLASWGVSDVEIRTESIGVGGRDKEIYNQCEKMLMDGVNIIAGYINPMTAEKLNGLFVNANAILLSLDAGYHYPSSLNKLSNTFYISLQGALCCRMVTKLATDDGAKKIAYTGSFYEAGYRSAYAFSKALNDVSGTITLNHITQLKRVDFTIEPLQQHLNSEDTDAVFASYCGDMLQDFYNGAADCDVFKKHPVYAAPFAGEQQWLDQCVYPGTDIKVCVPWARQLENEENARFVQVLSQKKQSANVFSLLGWEAGTIIASITHIDDPDDALAQLEQTVFQTPSGAAKFDAATHLWHAPVFNALVRKNADTGMCILSVVGESDQTEVQRQRQYDDIRNVNGSFTSWLNSYACLES